MLLAGCGDDEAAHRKAFITFLQTRIVDKPGVHLPRPTPDEEKGWGDYAKQYAIITGFNDALSQHVSKPMQDAAQRGAVTSLQGLVDRRADLRQIQQGMAALGNEVDRQLHDADAAHAKLNQPADLKAVYDQAYERDVTGLARAFKDVFPVTEDSLDAAASLGELLAANQSRVKLDGGMIQISDPTLLKDVQARITAMNGKAQQMQAAQQRLASLIAGP